MEFCRYLFLSKLQCNKIDATWSNCGTLLLFLSSSITGPSPKNFCVSLVNNSNLYPVFYLKI